MCRDAHERENLVQTNPEQMLTCSNGEERRRTYRTHRVRVRVNIMEHQDTSDNDDDVAIPRGKSIAHHTSLYVK